MKPTAVASLRLAAGMFGEDPKALFARGEKLLVARDAKGTLPLIKEAYQGLPRGAPLRAIAVHDVARALALLDSEAICRGRGSRPWRSMRRPMRIEWRCAPTRGSRGSSETRHQTRGVPRRRASTTFQKSSELRAGLVAHRCVASFSTKLIGYACVRPTWHTTL
ncbi:MAG: hypothetical protein JNJ88_10485 [Planctomycetes bacterium]|nr:hypothetical protein [Planctomycetota bacterium]